MSEILYKKLACPCCGKDIYIRYQTSPIPKILALVAKDGVISGEGEINDVDAIYNFWNEQHIIVHRMMTPDIAKAIKSELRNYTDAEIIQAVKNYAEIQKGEQYWFNYAWTLRDFLKRGISKFLDMEVARKNYLIKEPQSKSAQPNKYSAQKFSHLIRR